MIAIVPIRSGSKGIPNKNIKLFNGKPLVWWTLNSLEKSNVKKVIVSTDSKDYISLIKTFGFTKVHFYIRSQKCSTDEASTESVLIETINNIGLNDDIMLVQVTSPLTTVSDFNNGIDLYSKYDSILSVVPQKRFIWGNNGKPSNYNLNNRPRRQNWEGYLVENGAFYINSSKNILKTKNRLSGNIGLYKMSEYTFYEIDNECDWLILESIQNNIKL